MKQVMACVVATVSLLGCVQPGVEASRRHAEFVQEQAAADAKTATKIKQMKEGRIELTSRLKMAFEEAVGTKLKDSDSAKFRHQIAFKDGDGGLVECGEVNSRNSYGGYSGFGPYKARAFFASDGKIIPVGAFVSEEGHEQVFYKVAPECDPSNW